MISQFLSILLVLSCLSDLSSWQSTVSRFPLQEEKDNLIWQDEERCSSFVTRREPSPLSKHGEYPAVQLTAWEVAWLPTAPGSFMLAKPPRVPRDLRSIPPIDISIIVRKNTRTVSLRYVYQSTTSRSLSWRVRTPAWMKVKIPKYEGVKGSFHSLKFLSNALGVNNWNIHSWHYILYSIRASSNSPCDDSVSEVMGMGMRLPACHRMIARFVEGLPLPEQSNTLQGSNVRKKWLRPARALCARDTGETINLDQKDNNSVVQRGHWPPARPRRRGVMVEVLTWPCPLSVH